MNVNRSERGELRRLAGEAYARELDQSLRDLAYAFTEWESRRMDGFTLAQIIHEFHDGIARELWARYEQLPPEIAVKAALASGVIRPDELSGTLRIRLGPPLSG